MINEQAIRKMIDQVDNPEVRKTLENIIGGKIVKQVRCLSDDCNGKVVAHIYHDGQIIEVPTYNKKKELISGALTSRARFDGQLGFKCACGNTSILAEGERGIISGRTPTKDDLNQIYLNMEKKKPEYQEVDGTKEVDGFAIDDFVEKT